MGDRERKRRFAAEPRDSLSSSQAHLIILAPLNRPFQSAYTRDVAAAKRRISELEGELGQARAAAEAADQSAYEATQASSRLGELGQPYGYI